MALSISKTNESGFPDVYEYNDVSNEYTIKAVYEGGGAFSVDVIFAAVDTGVATVSLVNFSSTLENTNVIQISPNTLRISGNALNVFTDAYYQFIMPDKQLKILKADTTEVYSSLIKWEPPAVKVFHAVHSITCNVTTIGGDLSGITLQTFEFTQDVFWQWRYALQQFSTLLAKGTI